MYGKCKRTRSLSKESSHVLRLFFSCREVFKSTTGLIEGHLSHSRECLGQPGGIYASIPVTIGANRDHYYGELGNEIVCFLRQNS